MSWEDFEEYCLLYLRQQFAHIPNLEFSLLGKSNSQESDILVVKNKRQLFYIEVKMAQSQSGQFVVLSQENRFVYSPKNMHPADEYSREIIDYMNRDFDFLRQASTAGDILAIPSPLSASWIKQHYRNKDVSYIITHDGSDFIVLPLSKIDEYFDIEAKYRIKKSGSSDPSANNISELESLVNDSSAIYTRGEKSTYLQTTRPTIHDGIKLEGDKYSYLLNEMAANKYKVRRLSNTHNANVIFSIKLKKYPKSDITTLKSHLEL